MDIVGGEVQVGDLLCYDCRIMAGHGGSYQVRATVLGIQGSKVRVEYVNRYGERVRRWVLAEFLYRAR
jgi:hypothetical protein